MPTSKACSVPANALSTCEGPVLSDDFPPMPDPEPIQIDERSLLYGVCCMAFGATAEEAGERVERLSKVGFPEVESAMHYAIPRGVEEARERLQQGAPAQTAVEAAMRVCDEEVRAFEFFDKALRRPDEPMRVYLKEVDRLMEEEITLAIEPA
jgi:hypothetical protein